MSTYHGRPTSYRGDHRAPGRQIGRWLPLAVWGVGLVAIAALFTGWWV